MLSNSSEIFPCNHMPNGTYLNLFDLLVYLAVSQQGTLCICPCTHVYICDQVQSSSFILLLKHFLVSMHVRSTCNGYWPITKIPQIRFANPFLF